jgi:hypothetical protein
MFPLPVIIVFLACSSITIFSIYVFSDVVILAVPFISISLNVPTKLIFIFCSFGVMEIFEKESPSKIALDSTVTLSITILTGFRGL